MTAASGRSTHTAALKLNSNDIKSGTPPNVAPNRVGKPVFALMPSPSMMNPIVTKKPKNGTMTYTGASALRLLIFLISSGVNTWCFSTTCTSLLTPSRIPPE